MPVKRKDNRLVSNAGRLVPVMWLVISCCGMVARGESGSDWEIGRYGSVKVSRGDAGKWNAEVAWQEERDTCRIEIVYEGNVSREFAAGTKVQYWFRTWPGEPPASHTIEDRFDDPWQGQWLTAQVEASLDGNRATYRFKPLAKSENERADNLPGPVDYRRTLKIRLLYAGEPPRVSSLKVYSPTDAGSASVRIEFGCGRPGSRMAEGRLEIYSGSIEKVSGWGWESRFLENATRREA
jgi:hypothetical protein